MTSGFVEPAGSLTEAVIVFALAANQLMPYRFAMNTVEIRGSFQACLRANVPCLLISSSDLSGQLREMAEAGLPLRLDPRRCTVCNGLLEEIGSLEGQRWRCRDCGKLYWQGGHWKGIKKRLEELRR